MQFKNMSVYEFHMITRPETIDKFYFTLSQNGVSQNAEVLRSNN